ncbi:MAG: glycosyltransferase [Vicinamibacteria bacterium]|nr:glycosyltransferase [Vicinamibacteria bacterium]
MGRPLVTVVTPTFDRAGLLAETIESVLAQRHRPLEYIVVDDGSTDGTTDLLARHGAALVALRQDHAGEAQAVRSGVARARGDYVVVVNSDDPALPGLIEEQVACLEQRPALLACYPDWRVIDHASRVVGECRADEFDLRRMLLTHRAAPGPGAMIRREALIGAGVRDARYRYAADLAFWLRLGLSGQAERIPKTLTTYRQHAGALSRAERGAAMADEQVRVIEDFFALAELLPELREIRSRALAAAHYAAALIQIDGCPPAAGRHFRRSLALAPLRFESDERSHAVLLAGALAPPALLPGLQSLRARMRAA